MATVEIKEGSAVMQYDEKEAVFYNKVQVLNRDLSIQVIRLFSEIREREKTQRYEAKLARYNELLQTGLPAAPSSSSSSSSSSSRKQPQIKAPYELPKGIHILDALAATGLRSVRYLKEIPLARHVTINDLDASATEQARANCQQNGVDMDKVTISNGDAIALMHAHAPALSNFDVIDLDPYGTASPFLDAACAAVADGGLLCVTCTDMAVLCGSFPEKCYALYGAVPLKGGFVHEAALRILLHALEAAASRHKKHIVPWLSLSVDFYVRVFVRVYESPIEVKRSLLKRGMVYQSHQCPSFYIQPLGTSSATKRGNEQNYSGAPVTAPSTCEETGGRMRVGGPMWTDPIHSQAVVDTLLERVHPGSAYVSHTATQPRLFGLLTSLQEELKDSPLYYCLPELCATLQCTTPTTLDVHAALSNAGYQMSQFHHDPTAIKTNAPPSFVWDVMRAWCKLRPPEGSKHKKQSAAAASILARPSTHAVSFDVSEALQAAHDKRKRDAVARFPPNPEEFWGPKRRAGGGGGDDEERAEAAAGGAAEAEAEEDGGKEEGSPAKRKCP